MDSLQLISERIIHYKQLMIKVKQQQNRPEIEAVYLDKYQGVIDELEFLKQQLEEPPETAGLFED
ncbi:MAG: hypothetical protein D6675_03275 [Gemmatimonadetes bacterium]|nr:MAG: hypothetical protein D6675_03275 [Gemmatimonadota bacterium]